LDKGEVKIRGLTYVVGYGTRRRATILSRSLCNAIHDSGLESPRLLNAPGFTLFNGTILDQLEDTFPIFISNAPGYQLEFFPVNSSYAYDDSECTTYGKDRGDSVYMCLGSNRSTILAGSSVLVWH